MERVTLPRDDTGKLIAHAWPGGYPVFYMTKDGGTLCPDCATDAETEGITQDINDEQWYIIASDINWEDSDLVCDHCNAKIESAYGGD